MAITPTTGSAANSASAASLALPAFTLTAGQDVIVGVALGYTGSEAVTSITDDAGNTYTLKVAVNGTGIRTEEWQAQYVAARTNNVITIHVSPNTDIAAAAEEYVGTANTTFGPLSRSGWVASASDHYDGSGYDETHAINGNTSDYWHSATSAMPHWIAFDMLSPQSYSIITILHRQDAGNARAGQVDLYVSDDGISWGAVVETHTFASLNLITWTLSTTYTHRYAKINVVTSATGDAFVAMAEVNFGNTGSVPSQNTGSNSGSNTYPYQIVSTQRGNNYQVTVAGFAAHSGDTLTAQCGTSRQSSIPAATRSGMALYDNTMAGDGQVVVESLLSTARNWATAGLELQVTGGVAVTYVDYAATTAPALQVAKDVRYLRLLMPLGGGGSITPPSGEGQFWPPPIAKQGS